MKTKNILLVYPPQNVFCTKNMYPSGALLLIGTMCYNRGHNVKIVDMATDKIGIAQLKNIVLSFAPDIVGITVNTFQTKFTKEVTKAVKEVNENIITIAGGPHPSSLGLSFLNEFPHVDISVVGEGEFSFLEIVDGVDLKEIKGICYDGHVNDYRALATNLDHIPLSNLSLIEDINKYIGISGNGHSMFIMASRGCPFNCTFCNKSVFGNKVRFRTPTKIIEEIKWLNEQYGISEIYFQDDTFNLNRKWTEEILNLIIDNKLNTGITYLAPFRANEKLVDERLLQLAKEANFVCIFYGVESGNQEMLNRMQKALTINEIKRAFVLTHKHGIKTIASFIIGLPGETSETFKDTLNLWRELKPSYSGFTLATPFPNTEFERIVRSKGHLFCVDYDKYRCGGSYVRTNDLTRIELEYYSGIAILGQGHEWVYKFPIHEIAKTKLFCSVIVCIMRSYRILRSRLWKI